ncbi:protein eyes shut-like [Trichoplusia ni]|uniref:Protein eyes shut-like n=1 Tax=Trichoplusia ni TaxID=7111 RepID=A0A7E5WCF1_TRINI|nr:protein eyes shut-like [Trichoplusia ni]
MTTDHKDALHIQGRNVADCDGTACGEEACGGACVVEGGRARCACAAGPRCRRYAPCSRVCRPPGGRCRRDSCVCAAGYAGLFCDTKINVTIPQFDGTSLVSLGRRAASTHTNHQRVAPSLAKPNYMTLNFTTPEPNGLLMWILMDADYIGLGLENGYLRLVWSFHRNNDVTRTEPSRTLARLLPHAGFLTDAEWHTLELKMDSQNITLTVDRTLVYAEEPGLVQGTDYEEIDVFIGGITEQEHAIAKKIFPYNFKGCIDHISTREKSYVTNYTELYSENVKSCQLFPPT